MNIPFLSYFKKKPKAEPVPAPAPVQKPSSERLSKTVMPSARSHPAFDHAHGSGNGAVATTAPPVPRTVAFGGGNGSGQSVIPASNGLPPAVALALEPRVERAISIDLADVIAQMPEGLVRPIQEGDMSRRVLLKAAELERGMANGKPMVSIATIYQQVPEIFLRPIEAPDTTQLHLPFQKVLEQFTTLQTRSDQYRDQAVPQVETPFLRVALEDGSQFGTPLQQLETCEPPPVRLEPATAESLAAAEPEPASQQAIRISVPGVTPPAVNGNGAADTAQKPVALRMPTAPSAPTADTPAAAPTSHAPSAAAPARIPFKLSPNGTDAPAIESVPASGGASVPTSTPAPVRIPFQLNPPAEEACPKGEPWLTKDNFETAGEAAPAADGAPAPDKPPTVSLPLKPIFLSLPPAQVKGDFDDMPGALRVELPFSIIEPQLALGRIAVTPEQFAAALPEEFRGLFDETVAGGVVLPLHEVLKNLPAATLRMREDQEEQEKGANFATPFSAKAEEDAKRFNVAPTP
ncbi:MAG: hypothetical protein H0V56_02315, partial [Chthoniobacterales bacterium]|nr:hypothetical protein [Chthoniobacterales bacterium]